MLNQDEASQFCLSQSHISLLKKSLHSFLSSGTFLRKYDLFVRSSPSASFSFGPVAVWYWY